MSLVFQSTGQILIFFAIIALSPLMSADKPVEAGFRLGVGGLGV